MKISINWNRSKTNSHGTPGVTPWDRKTLRSTWQIVALGRDSWQLAKGRTLIGRRLWLYGPSGAGVYFDIYVKFERCPYRPGSKYGRCLHWVAPDFKRDLIAAADGLGIEPGYECPNCTAWVSL